MPEMKEYELWSRHSFDRGKMVSVDISPEAFKQTKFKKFRHGDRFIDYCENQCIACGVKEVTYLDRCGYRQTEFALFYLVEKVSRYKYYEPEKAEEDFKNRVFPVLESEISEIQKIEE